MAKSLGGLLLFCSIVVTSILVTMPSFWVGNDEKKIVESKNSISSVKVKLIQAIFNSKTKQLESSLTIEDKNDKFHSVVTYHFFVKEKGQAKYLRSETLRVVKNLQHISKITEEENSTFPWLENFVGNGNLFIVIEYNQNELKQVKSIPEFDEVTAVPVLFF